MVDDLIRPNVLMVDDLIRPNVLMVDDLIRPTLDRWCLDDKMEFIDP